MLFSCAGDLLELHSFPTRRSSDLLGEVVGSQMRGLAVTTTDRLPLGREVLEDDADALATERRAAGTLHPDDDRPGERSEEHTSELQSRGHLVCRLLLEKKKTRTEL